MMAKKTDEQIDEEMGRSIAEGHELEGWTPIKSKNKVPRAVYGLRLSPEEFEEFSAAARGRGLTLSDFLRQAASDAAAGRLNHEEAETVRQWRFLVAQMNRVVGRLPDSAMMTKSSSRARAGSR